MKKMSFKSCCLFTLLCLFVAPNVIAQINSGNPQVPFGSVTSYTYGIMPTNLPSGGTYGSAQDAADQYAYWKAQFVSSCSNGRYRVNFDNPAQTVSEGIAYGMLIAAYAADKDLFDGLWHYYRDHMNSNGVMHWRINGCSSVVGFNGAADAEVDAAMALIVAETQWPTATSPFDYGAEASTLIGNVKAWEMHPSSHQLINGDGWGFGNNCRNPSYQSPGYYKVYAQHTGDSYWTNSAVPAAYTLLNNNVNTTTGLVSNWSDPSGTPNGCNGPNEYGYDACRNPWRMATDVIWFNDADAAEMCNDLASWSSGVGVGSIGGPRSQNGGGSGAHNTTFVSTYAAGIMGANSSYQNHMNNFYAETVAVTDNAYFGETLKTIMLFMMTGNFWNPFDFNGGGTCSSPDLGADVSLCGVSSVTLNSGVAVDGVKTFQWFRNNNAQGSPSTSATTFNATQAGTYRVVVDSAGACSQEDEIVVSASLNVPDLGADVALCATPSETLDAGVSGAGISYTWERNNVVLSGETNQTLVVSEAGTYEVTVSASSCSSQSDQVVVTSSIPTTVNDTVCAAGQQVTLTATGGGNYSWFASASSSTALATGGTYAPTISNTTTYWVAEESGSTVTVGPSDAGSGPWSISDFSSLDKQLYVDALTDVTLSSVSVSSPSNQSVTIRVFNDATNQEIASETQSVGSGIQAVAMSVALTSGTRYRIDAVGTSGQLTFKNQGSPSYPITETGVATLTNTESWNSSWSLFFNLEFSTGQTCTRVPVTGVVDPSNAACTPSCTTPTQPVITQGAAVAVCEGESITLTTNAQANSTTWDFTWYRGSYPSGTIVAGPTEDVSSLSYSVSSTAADTYTIVVRDKSQPADATCIATASITVSETSLPTANITTSNLAYCSDENGLTLTAQNAGAGASYSWSGPVTGSGMTLSNATAGSYTVDVTRQGCSATSAPVLVTENAAPVAMITTTDLTYCEGDGGVTLTAQDAGVGASYSWSGPTSGSGMTLANATAGTYAVVVSQNGCSATSSSVTVTETSAPVASIATTALSYCIGVNGVTLEAANAGSGATYTWSGPVSGSGSTLSNATAGDYSVTVSRNGCSATSSIVTVTEISAPVAAITTTDLTYCSGDGGVTLSAMNAGGGATYAWNGPVTGSGIELNNATAGSYTVTVMQGGCDATSTMVTVTENSTPSAVVTSTNLSYCEGTSGVSLSAADAGNGASYSWSGPVTGTGLTLTNATAGDYSVEVTLDGCSSTSSTVTVTENSLPVASIETSGQALTYCVGNGVTLEATNVAGATYAWFDTANQPIGSGNPINNVLAGSYYVEVTQNGCSAASATVSVTQSGGVNAAIVSSGEDLTYCEGESGATLIAEDAGAGATYAWFNGSSPAGTGIELADVEAGTYTVEVTIGACAGVSTPVTVQEVSTPTANIVTTDLSYCENNAGVTLEAEDAGNGATYEWTGTTNGNGIQLTNASAGSYEVQVTLNGCVATSAPVTVVQNTIPQASISTTAGELSYCAGSSGTIITAVDEPGAFYTWISNNSIVGTGNPLVGALQGIYEVQVTRDGCENTSNAVSVQENDVPASLSAITGEAEICPNTTETYSVNAASGAEAYTWSLPAGAALDSDNGNIVTITFGNAGGVLTVEASNECGASNGASLTISTNGEADPIVSIEAQQNPVCEGGVAILTATNSAGAAGPYVWTVGGQVQNSTNGTLILSNVQGGESVQAEISVNSLCGAVLSGSSEALELSVVDAPVITDLSGPEEACNLGGQVFTYSVVGDAQDTYTWNVPDGASINNQGASSVTINFTGAQDGFEAVSVTAVSPEGCASNSLFQLVELTCVVGLPEEVNSVITAFPNPASESVYFTWSGVELGEVKAELIDAKGVVLSSKTTNADGVDFEVEGYEGGVYQLRLIHESGTYFTKVTVMP